MRSTVNKILSRAKANLEAIVEYAAGKRQKTFAADDIDLEDDDWFKAEIDEHDQIVAVDEQYRTSNLIQLMDAYCLRRDTLYTYSQRPWHMNNGHDSKLGDEFRSGYIESWFTKLKEREEDI